MIKDQTIADILESSEGVDSELRNIYGDKPVDIKEKIAVERFYKEFEKRKKMKDKFKKMDEAFCDEE
jgi:hypothetical protein